MPPNASGLADAASVIGAAVRRRIRDRQGGAPLLVAIDGGSGSGKSTLADLVAAELDAVIAPSDDFFAADITDAEWDAMEPQERAAAAIDWRRLRREALEPLLAGRSASWHPFDFAPGTRPDGNYPMAAKAVTRVSASVIVLEGAYSCRPEISDLIGLSVLVDHLAPTRRSSRARFRPRQPSSNPFSFHTTDRDVVALR